MLSIVPLLSLLSDGVIDSTVSQANIYPILTTLIYAFILTSMNLLYMARRTGKLLELLNKKKTKSSLPKMTITKSKNPLNVKKSVR